MACVSLRRCCCVYASLRRCGAASLPRKQFCVGDELEAAPSLHSCASQRASAPGCWPRPLPPAAGATTTPKKEKSKSLLLSSVPPPAAGATPPAATKAKGKGLGKGKGKGAKTAGAAPPG